MYKARFLLLAVLAASPAYASQLEVCSSLPLYKDGHYDACSISIGGALPYLYAPTALTQRQCETFCHSLSSGQISALLKKQERNQSVVDLDGIQRAQATRPDKQGRSFIELGSGAWGSVLDNGTDWVIKSPRDQYASLRQVRRMFKAEVQHQTKVADAFVFLQRKEFSLSPLTFFERSVYCEDKDSAQDLHESTLFWLQMRRINIAGLSSSRGTDRQLLYKGRLDDAMRDLLRAVGEAYAIHLVGARLQVPKDLELVVSTISDHGKERRIVTLLDYGLVEGFHTFKPQMISNMHTMIPPPDDQAKFVYFSNSFLAVARRFGDEKLGLEILEALERNWKAEEGDEEDMFEV